MQLVFCFGSQGYAGPRLLLLVHLPPPPPPLLPSADPRRRSPVRRAAFATPERFRPGPESAPRYGGSHDSELCKKKRVTGLTIRQSSGMTLELEYPLSPSSTADPGRKSPSVPQLDIGRVSFVSQLAFMLS